MLVTVITLNPRVSKLDSLEYLPKKNCQKSGQSYTCALGLPISAQEFRAARNAMAGTVADCVVDYDV
jgi:hypothetical protein